VEISKLDERKVVEYFAKYLSDQSGGRLWYHTSYVVPRSEFFPTQPEVDLVFGQLEGGVRVPPVSAAEVKYIRFSGGRYVSYSYYSGLDESLALLVLGFDRVYLIHLVEGHLLETDFRRSVKVISDMIKELRLPVGYIVYAVSTLSGEPYFYRRVPGVDLRELWVDPLLNPLLQVKGELGEMVRKNRRSLLHELHISLGHVQL